MSNKPTLLDRYWKMRLDFQDTHKESMPTSIQLWSFQELLYRICVLEVFQQFAKSAPFSGEMKSLISHYAIVDAYVENLKRERDIPSPDNPDAQKKRETAFTAMLSVIEDYRRRYASYKATGPEQYGKDIGRTIATVLPAWVQYRNTICEIKISEE